MTPLDQLQVCRDTGALPTLPGLDNVSPMAVGAVGSIAGILLLVNARDKLLKIAGGLLFASALYYGIAMKKEASA